MTVRPMAAADLETVRLMADATPEASHWAPLIYQAFLEPGAGPPRRILVAEISGELAGFIAGRITVDICELESIAVAPRHRHTGIGSSLLAALIAWAGELRVLKIQLEVRSANYSAIGFYERSGFRRDGLRRGYYRDPDDDALLMSLTLAAPFVPWIFASRSFPQNQR